MRSLLRAIDWLTDASAALAAALLGVMVTSFWIEVAARYFFKAPTSWAQSVTSYALLASVMLMLPYLTRSGQHVGMSLVYEALPHRAAQALAGILAAVSVVVCLLSAWICGVETLRQYRESVLTTNSMFLPMWTISIFLVYGFALAAVHFLRQAIAAEVPHFGEG